MSLEVKYNGQDVNLNTSEQEWFTEYLVKWGYITEAG